MKKTVKSATKKVAANKAAKKVAAKKTVKRAAKKTTARKRPITKPAPASAVAALPKTSIVAYVDVGFGNALYLRGEAPGLSWSKGVPMDCRSANEWSISMAGVKEGFAYKLLINDSQWAKGDNAYAKPGVVNEISPSF